MLDRLIFYVLKCIGLDRKDSIFVIVPHDMVSAGCAICVGSSQMISIAVNIMIRMRGAQDAGIFQDFPWRINRNKKSRSKAVLTKTFNRILAIAIDTNRFTLSEKLTFPILCIVRHKAKSLFIRLILIRC